MRSSVFLGIFIFALIAMAFIPLIQAQCTTNAPNAPNARAHWVEASINGGCFPDFKDRDARCGGLMGTNSDTRFSFDGPGGKCYCCPA
uniref:Uncharacterized protein n=1 Tax=Panagrolaimus sp. PS1159 TaxID=55785 RepID=A0AC35F9N7_9BILA